MTRRSVPATWLATARGQIVPRLFPLATMTRVAPPTNRPSTDIPRSTVIEQPIRRCFVWAISRASRRDGTLTQERTIRWEREAGEGPGAVGARLEAGPVCRWQAIHVAADGGGVVP